MHIAALLIILIMAGIAKLCDDGSRYLCPRCKASLRPYVQSCRFCRARFKVQQMTTPTKSPLLTRELWPAKPKRAKLPDPATMRACFRMPERDHYERPATRDQKHELELIGATNYRAIDALGENQAQYLLKFSRSLAESENQQRQATKASQRRSSILSVAGAVGATIIVVGLVLVLGTRAPTAGAATKMESARPAGESVAASAAEVAVADGLPSQATPEPSTKIVGPTPRLTAANYSRPTAPKVTFNDLVNASKTRAAKFYPSLQVAGSHLNTAFVASYRQLVESHSPLLNEPDWPEQLALECSMKVPPAYQ